jgi:hypothetical protein
MGLKTTLSPHKRLIFFNNFDLRQKFPWFFILMEALICENWKRLRPECDLSIVKSAKSQAFSGQSKKRCSEPVPLTLALLNLLKGKV